MVILFLLCCLLNVNHAIATEAIVNDGSFLDAVGDQQNNKNLKPYLDAKQVRIASGISNGFYYHAASNWARLLLRSDSNIKPVVLTSGGSVANIQMLYRNEVDVILAQSDIQEQAYNGLASFQNSKLQKIRFLFSMHNEPMVFIVKAGSNINNLDDLLNKVIDIGPKGSGSAATFYEIMKAKGWSANNFKRIVDAKLMEAPEKFCRGEVEAALSLAGQPNPLVEKLAQNCSIALLPLDDEAVNQLIAANTEFVDYVIPGGTYAGTPHAVATLATKATVLSSTDVSEELVYNITKTFFENIEVLRGIHPIFNELQPHNMVKEARTAPYHPGAYKYFVEQNLITE